jgi:basic membrane protein A and related proteins
VVDSPVGLRLTGENYHGGRTRQLFAGILLVVVAALLAAGCGGDEAATPTTTAQTAGLKVGLITDLGQLNDNGFNELAYKGLKRAQHELGIEGRVVESRSAADYVPNMTSLVRKGYDLIIGVGFAQGDAIATAARRFPDVKFAIVDVDQASLKGKPTNVEGLLFREEQVGYLAGYLAALTAKRAGRETVSAVGGFKEPPVDRFIAGYQAGARAAVPGTEVLHAYSQDWDDQAKCKELALDQIARGSEVVFQVAGGCGLGALSAAKDKSVWGIGVDADQSFLGPHVLTSALKGVDQAVFLTIKSVMDDGWHGGGNAVFGLDQSGVGLGTVSPRASKQDVAKVEKVERRIQRGEIVNIPTSV